MAYFNINFKSSSFFFEISHVAYQSNGNEAQITMQANILLVYTSSTSSMGSYFFLKWSCCISKRERSVKQHASKLSDLMHSTDLGKKVRY